MLVNCKLTKKSLRNRSKTAKKFRIFQFESPKVLGFHFNRLYRLLIILILCFLDLNSMSLSMRDDWISDHLETIKSIIRKRRLLIHMMWERVILHCEHTINFIHDVETMIQSRLRILHKCCWLKECFRTVHETEVTQVWLTVWVVVTVIDLEVFLLAHIMNKKIYIPKIDSTFLRFPIFSNFEKLALCPTIEKFGMKS